MSAGIRRRLAVFAVVSAVAVGWTGTRYARLTDHVIDTTYAVDVQLERSGGIFEGAEVTYRGVPVGRVARVDLSPDGIVAGLEIDDEWDVPVGSVASVHNRSAVGEQYVDLVPAGTGPPYLRDGAEIPRERTSVPLEEEELLQATRDLARSVPLDDLRTVVAELGSAFAGSGQDLQRILDGSDALLGEAMDHLPQTVALLRSSGVALRTVNASASGLQSFAQDLRTFSGALRASDADLRTTIAQAGGFAQANRRLLADLDRELPGLLESLAVLNAIGSTHLPHMEQFLVALPISLRTIAAARHGRASFVSSVTPTPKVCREGYLPPSRWRSTTDESPAAPDYSVRCREGLPTLPRGSSSAPGPTR